MKLRLVKRRLIKFTRMFLERVRSIVPPMFNINWNMLDMKLVMANNSTYTAEEKVERSKNILKRFDEAKKQEKERAMYGKKTIRIKD
jgi:hypothetical protein